MRSTPFPSLMSALITSVLGLGSLYLAWQPPAEAQEDEEGGGGGGEEGGEEGGGREPEDDTSFKWNAPPGPRSPLEGVLPFPPGTLPDANLGPRGDLYDVTELTRSGDLAHAREELDAWFGRNPPADQQIYGIFVRGHLEEAEGQLDRAQKTWASLRGQSAGLNAEIAASEGRVLLRMGKATEAVSRLQAAADATPEGSFRDYLLAEVGSALFRAGKYTEAYALFEDLQKKRSSPSERLTLRLAEIDLTRGDADAAAETLDRLSAGAESCSVASEADRILKKAGKSAPTPSGAGLARDLQRVERMSRCGAHAEGAALLKRLEGRVETTTLEENWLKLWYHKWDLKQILSWCDERLATGVPDDVKRRLLRWQAKAWWRLGQSAKAADLRLQSNATGGVTPTNDQKFYAAQLYMEAHHFTRARQLFDEVMANKPTSQQRLDAEWYRAWAALQLGDLEVARVGLEAISNRAGKNSRLQACQYWLMRLHLAAGRPDEAQAWLDRLRAEELDGFYVFLAEALNLPEIINRARATGGQSLTVVSARPAGDRAPAEGKFPALPLPRGVPERSLTLEKATSDPAGLGLPPPWSRRETPEYEIWSERGHLALEELATSYGDRLPGLLMARELARCGWFSEAAEWLKVTREGARDSKDSKIYRMSREITALHYAYWYLHSPWYAQLVMPSEGGPLPPLGKDTTGERYAWERRYPRAFSLEVSRAATTWRVDPALIYGIMRTESNYGPSRSSPVGARGLMQIMPATGARIAALLAENFDTDDLFVPATNIRFGAWYLARLLEKFHGQLPLAVASYNAGPRYVEGWARRAAGVPVDVFIEEVPLKETREYVRKVLRSMSIYRVLYGHAAHIPLRGNVDGDVAGGVDF